MLRNLFRIWIKPKDTLDRLLFEGNMKQSWAGTWLLAVIGACSTILAFVPFSQSEKPSGLYPLLRQALPTVNPGTLLAVGIVVFALFAIVGQVLARLLFPWYVRMGLRMVAGGTYPKSKEERRAKARSIQLIHPYTAGIEAIPGLVFSLVSISIGANQSVPSGGHNLMLILGVALIQIAIGLITLGFVIYMIVVRVMAIRKIYNVSTGHAFSGPFLMYFFSYLAVMILCIAIGIWAAITFGHIPQNPSM